MRVERPPVVVGHGAPVAEPADRLGDQPNAHCEVETCTEVSIPRLQVRIPEASEPRVIRRQPIDLLEPFEGHHQGSEGVADTGIAPIEDAQRRPIDEQAPEVQVVVLDGRHLGRRRELGAESVELGREGPQAADLARLDWEWACQELGELPWEPLHASVGHAMVEVVTCPGDLAALELGVQRQGAEPDPRVVFVRCYRIAGVRGQEPPSGRVVGQHACDPIGPPRGELGGQARLEALDGRACLEPDDSVRGRRPGDGGPRARANELERTFQRRGRPDPLLGREEVDARGQLPLAAAMAALMPSLTYDTSAPMPTKV